MPRSIVGPALCTSLVAGLLAGCVFDPSGIFVITPDARRSEAKPLPDRARPEATPALPEAGPDSRADLGVVDEACRNGETGVLVSGPACQFGSGDSIGQSGICKGGKFQRLRYCFEGAPCSTLPVTSGLCIPSSCGKGCDSTGDCQKQKVCSYFYSAGFNASCCVGASGNGGGDAATPCSSGDGCLTGLCLDAGFCYVACKTTPDSCPTGQVCTTLELSVTGSKLELLGCKVAPPSLDSGPDAPTWPG